MAEVQNDLPVQMIKNTRQFVEQRKKELPLAGMRALATMQKPPIDLTSRIRAHKRVSLITQIKRNSPDMEQPVESYAPLTLAKKFERSGAQALCVATDQKYYQGGTADLILVTQDVDIPVIRQDLIFDEYQIVESRAAGADAVILSVSLLHPRLLRDLISLTQRNRMTAVVQVETVEEVQQAVQFEPRMILINNRSLRTLQVRLDTTRELRPYVPSHIAVASMGGLRSASDVAYVCKAGLDAVVIGQALLTASDPTIATQELLRLTQEISVVKP